jgi:hypothetical protein
MLAVTGTFVYAKNGSSLVTTSKTATENEGGNVVARLGEVDGDVRLRLPARDDVRDADLLRYIVRRFRGNRRRRRWWRRT